VSTFFLWRVSPPKINRADQLSRSCVIKGQSPRNLVSLAQDPTQRQMLFDMIAPDLAQKLRCQELVGKCSEAVLENGVRSMSHNQELALDKLLRAYEDQVDGIELQAVAGMFFTHISAVDSEH